MWSYEMLCTLMPDLLPEPTGFPKLATFDGSCLNVTMLSAVPHAGFTHNQFRLQNNLSWALNSIL